jgi:hypothetical protein
VGEDISLFAVEEDTDIAEDVPSTHLLDFPSFFDLDVSRMVGSDDCSAQVPRNEMVIDVLAASPTFPPIETAWLYPNRGFQHELVGGHGAYDSERVPSLEEQQQAGVAEISL